MTCTRTPGTLPSMDTNPVKLVVAPEWHTNKWPTKLTRTVLHTIGERGIINVYDLLKTREPAIGWQPQGVGARDLTVAAWLLWVKGYKFPGASWYNHGALSFAPMCREDKQAKLAEAIYKADALGLCAPHQWVKTPWGDYVPVAACRRAWERAFPGKVFPLDTATATVVKGGR